MATAKKPAAKRPSTTQQLAMLSEKMEEMTRSYQEQLEDQQRRYNELVDAAQQQMEALVGAAQISNNPKPAPKPQAVWHEENGEQLLVLNKPAAEFFMKIFENVGVLAEELQKQIVGAKK